MHIPKKYFHDRLVLLLLGLNTFVAMISSVLIALKVDTTEGSTPFVQYRANLGVSLKTGSNSELLSFIVFILIVLTLVILISMRTYGIKRDLSVTVLALGLLLLILAGVVANSLLFLS